MLVACSAGPEPPKGYIDLVFGWYYDRTRIVRGVIAASFIGAGITVITQGSNLLGTTEIVAIEAVLVIAYLVLHRVLVLPLHRELLCCLALSQQLKHFEPALRAALRTDGQPDPRAYRNWSPKRPHRRAILEHLKGAHRTYDLDTRLADPGQDRELVVGRYLLEVLGPVPTDEYEKRLTLRRKVDEYLRELTLKVTPIPS